MNIEEYTFFEKDKQRTDHGGEVLVVMEPRTDSLNKTDNCKARDLYDVWRN